MKEPLANCLEENTPQSAAFPGDLLRPSPKYRGTSGFPVSLTSNTFLKKKKSCTLLDRMPQCKEYSPSIFKPPFAKHLELGFVLFCFLITPPHNLKLLHVLIIQFQNTKLLLHRVLMKRPTQLDNHRFCHERAARCPFPSLSWSSLPLSPRLQQPLPAQSSETLPVLCQALPTPCNTPCPYTSSIQQGQLPCPFRGRCKKVAPGGPKL